MSKRKNDEEPPQLEPAMAELEQIVRRLEQGGGTLEEDLTGYSRAIGLIQLCHQRLAKAERTVELLSGVDSEGNPIAQPFDQTAQSLDQTAKSLEQKRADRSRRRSADSIDSIDIDETSF
ncbi:MAG: exodeoxyribonuclease VII small subunit [Pirellulaceae bacterium]|nr:exodeoxyribonuclease VII small subunit [Pirellulaceae bacterium]